MSDPSGDKLFVNLSAAQTRRRLKGLGMGVRKVQSAGRNRAVIIHTATGRHREQLESQFADVGCAQSEESLGENVENLFNLGISSGAWLRDVGIRTGEDLQRIGPVVAYMLVKQRQPAATITLLWAMAAGLKGIDLRHLTDAEKAALWQQLAALAGDD